VFIAVASLVHHRRDEATRISPAGVNHSRRKRIENGIAVIEEPLAGQFCASRAAPQVSWIGRQNSCSSADFGWLTVFRPPTLLGAPRQLVPSPPSTASKTARLHPVL